MALQKILTDRLYRRIDKERANQLTMREFMQDLSKGSLPFHYSVHSFPIESLQQSTVLERK